jgi:hypothetical protein
MQHPQCLFLWDSLAACAFAASALSAFTSAQTCASQRQHVSAQQDAAALERTTPGFDRSHSCQWVHDGSGSGAGRLCCWQMEELGRLNN